MNYMQLKTGPGAVSGEEREGFCLKAYRKSELAGLYFPQAGKKGALQGLGAMDQAVCGTGKGARAVGLPEKPQVFPEIGGGTDCEVPWRAVSGGVSFF